MLNPLELEDEPLELELVELLDELAEELDELELDELELDELELEELELDEEDEELDELELDEELDEEDELVELDDAELDDELDDVDEFDETEELDDDEDELDEELPGSRGFAQPATKEPVTAAVGTAVSIKRNVRRSLPEASGAAACKRSGAGFVGEDSDTLTSETYAPGLTRFCDGRASRREGHLHDNTAPLDESPHRP